jgi:hypothetical protein
MRRTLITTILTSALVSGLFVTGPALAEAVRKRGGLSVGLANSLYCQLAGCTMVGSTTYSGANPDVTTVGNEDFVIDPAGTGSTVFSSGDNLSEIREDDGTTVRILIETATSQAGGRIYAQPGSTMGAIQFDGAQARVGAIDARAAGSVVFSVADGISATTGTDLLTVDGAGSAAGTQVTTGTPQTWRVPTAIAASGITLPTCSTSADAGKLVYIDDSNDTAAAVLCVCRAGADDTTYTLVQVADNTTACIDP